MQNKGFLEFIEKLQAAASGKKAEQAQPPDASGKLRGGNFSEKTQSGGVRGTTNDGVRGEKLSGQNKSEVKAAVNLIAPANEKSYIKTYNPFGEALSPRPQIAAPRAKKQPKEKIDLSLGKNLAGEKKNEASKNMLDLIKRHNALSREIKSAEHLDAKK